MALSFHAVKTSVLCAKDLHRASKITIFLRPKQFAVLSLMHFIQKFVFCPSFAVTDTTLSRGSLNEEPFNCRIDGRPD